MHLSRYAEMICKKYYFFWKGSNLGALFGAKKRTNSRGPFLADRFITVCTPGVPKIGRGPTEKN